MDATREQIMDALLSYTRGIDRLRARDVVAAFHDGALLHGYGPEPMAVEKFAAYAVESLGNKYVATQHRMSNTRITFTDGGAGALVESYVEASHAEPPAADGTQRLLTFAGRYIDRCTPGDDGVWRIAIRTLRNDWSKVEVITEPMRGAWVASGRGDTSDPLFDELDDQQETS